MKYLIILMFPIITFASEGDAFSARLHRGYKDMGPKLSREVERRLNIALNSANKKNHKCDESVAMKAIEGEFLRPVVGIFETWASFSADLEGHHVKLKDSIYKDLKFSENWPVHAGKFGMATFFRINRTLVASDKFGHFFDEGHTYYKIVNVEGKSMATALQKGIDLENGIYGLERSKVFSYADLVANRSGYEFWNSLFNDRKNNNYISCIDGKFRLTRTFSFAEYVNSGWDESINCNSYPPSVEERVNKVIAELEEKSGKVLSCESRKKRCSFLINKYGSEAQSLISPKCFE